MQPRLSVYGSVADIVMPIAKIFYRVTLC